MAVNNAINSGSLGTGFVYNNGAGLLSAGPAIKVTKYTSNDTWTKDAQAQVITAIVWSGGSGGGSGRQGLTTAAGGGGGGSAGSVTVWTGLASFFNSTESVVVGAGGAGGVAQTSASTNGNDGTVGGNSSFGNITATNGTTSGGGGGTATTSAFIGLNLLVFPSASSLAVAASPYDTLASALRGSNAAPSAMPDLGWIVGSTGVNIVYIAGCGGAGSGADTVTPRQASNGCNFINPGANLTSYSNTGGTGGIASGTINGGAGNNAITTTGGLLIGATGGGGGGGQNSGGSAGIGGAGGIPGGGGGGGGGSINGTNSGAGGNGGRGEVWVIEYLG